MDTYVILSNKRVICKLTIPLLYQQATPTSQSERVCRLTPTKMAAATENKREAWVSLAMEEAKISTYPGGSRPPLKTTKLQS